MREHGGYLFPITHSTPLYGNMDFGTIRIILFIAATFFLLYISRRSLRDYRSHGFHRFFAWEFILALLLINIPRWFVDPFSIPHLLSWIFLAVSLLLAIIGPLELRKAGKRDGGREEELYSFEKTSALVTSGIYRRIRHPMYASLLYLAWGTFLKDVNAYSISLVAAATLSLVATAKSDETECLRYFGSAYTDYMGRTKMFMPFVI